MDRTQDRNNTQASLIKAGLHLFGHKGYEGTSTRELAAHAKTNIASINYHFGGKAGLRTACTMAVTGRLSDVLDNAGILEAPETAEDAANQIERLVRAFVELIVGKPEAQDMVAFMLREIVGPGEIAETVYENFVEPRHKALCALWAAATGRDPNSDEVKLTVFAVIGQIVYFRIASAFVVRRMDWDAIGSTETQKVATAVIANLRDTIERQRL